MPSHHYGKGKVKQGRLLLKRATSKFPYRYNSRMENVSAKLNSQLSLKILEICWLGTNEVNIFSWPRVRGVMAGYFSQTQGVVMFRMFYQI